jgi:hypothetical protein
MQTLHYIWSFWTLFFHQSLSSGDDKIIPLKPSFTNYPTSDVDIISDKKTVNNKIIIYFPKTLRISLCRTDYLESNKRILQNYRKLSPGIKMFNNSSTNIRTKTNLEHKQMKFKYVLLKECKTIKTGFYFPEIVTRKF